MPALLIKCKAQMTSKKHLFKVVFFQKDNIFEIYAKQVFESDMYGFIVVEDILFGEASSVLVDPSEEKLRNLFGDVTRTFIPIHSIIRIDEVEKQGSAKIIKSKGSPGQNNISQFPSGHFPKDSDNS